MSIEVLSRRFEMRADAKGDYYLASLSSEAPVERDFGVEILDHSPQAIDLSRARDGLPLLFNHDLHQLVGRVDHVRVADKRMRGEMRFFDTAHGRDARTVVDSGHREVSVRYEILKTRNEPEGVVRVTRWRPYEASVVSVPADATIGIGRSASHHLEHTMNPTENEDTDLDTNADAGTSRSQRRAAKAATTAAQLEIDARLQEERDRVKTIKNIARGNHMDDATVERAIESGMSLHEFSQGVLEHLAARSRGTSVFLPASSFGNSDGASPQDREWSTLANGFSVARSIQATIDPATYMRSSGREAEVSRELQRRSALPTSGTLVPIGAFFRPMMQQHQRALSAGTASLGGATVQTTIDASLFADALRGRVITVGLGARVLPGLTDTLVIPRKTATTTAAWLTEVGAASSTDPTFDQVTLAPKRIGAYTDMSKQLLVQSVIAMEQIVQQDLTNSILVEVDRIAMFGTGASNQPRGIVNTVGIGAVVGGANGAQINWGHVLDLERAVAAANAQTSLGSSGYAINPATRGWLKRTLKVAAVEGLIMGDDPFDANGLTNLNSYRAAVSTLLPSNGTKGASGAVCSTLIFGDWSQLFIGMFGDAVELIVDPYTLATTGQVRVTANLFADIGVRYPTSFAAFTDALTA